MTGSFIAIALIVAAFTGGYALGVADEKSTQNYRRRK